MVEREYGLKEWQRQLEEEWDKLTEEAKKDLETEEENFFVFRYALLKFALDRAIPPWHPLHKKFSKLVKFYF